MELGQHWEVTWKMGGKGNEKPVGQTRQLTMYCVAIQRLLGELESKEHVLGDVLINAWAFL